MGCATAVAFDKLDACLALTDVSEKSLKETADYLQNVPLTAVLDMRNVAAIRQWLEQVKQKLGPVRVFANCAGVWQAASYYQISEEHWDFILDINLKGNFFFCQAVMKQMQEAGGGSIVNIASTAGEYGNIRAAAHYAASRGGVIAMSKSLAREGAPHIRVNSTFK
jgi:2-hydroxycyclohexanecarboxyl-CoA dehydrogenase